MGSNKTKAKPLKSEDSSKAVRQLLFDLLSHKGLIEAAKRFEAAEMLANEVTYQAIQKETGLSSTTIASVAKWLKCGMSGYRTATNRFRQAAEKHKFLHGEWPYERRSFDYFMNP